MKNMKITIEFECEDCEGEGSVVVADSTGCPTVAAACSSCDGTGHMTALLPLKTVKKLLEDA